jgi:DNA-binding TFAR19-related protein (PDSD5 family)
MSKTLEGMKDRLEMCELTQTDLNKKLEILETMQTNTSASHQIDEDHIKQLSSKIGYIENELSSIKAFDGTQADKSNLVGQQHA